MDARMKSDIMMTVYRAVRHAIDERNEQYLSGTELCEQFQCFTPSWLKVYGHLLPRVQITVLDGDVERKTGWAYPRHAIAKMIAENKLYLTNKTK